ncbi:P22 phage major capsid protein family protein [Gulosibacter faecalis]|uniref:P22 phage major capsid protein family protein n=1 Tax=Gulosibacter faecalis TaxID=272240 RepID=A0ABW5UXD8_9MICO|nr:P22 phage major capsid protein family protein [Gulosibacter faecalis]
MATNIFDKGEKLAATALALLKREVKAPGLFPNKLTKADFAGAKDDTVMVRRPVVLQAREKEWRGTDAIIVDRIVKTKIPVVLNKHPYNAVGLTSEEATLDEVDYVRDIQQPQVAALVEYFEDTIVGALRGADFTMEVPFTPSVEGRFADPRKVALRARKLFQDAHVPTAGRYWLVGSSVAEAISGYDKLLDVDTAGLPEALREGVVGKLAGFTIIELDALGEDESYFVHNSALAIAVVAPVVPQGAAKGGSARAGHGLAVTQVWDYDGSTMLDRSVVHAFVGASLITDPEVDEAGAIVLDGDDKPQLEFRRAIRVNFDSGETAEEEPTAYTLQVTGAPTGGTYTLEVDGDETAAIAFDATNAAIAAAINALEGISGVKVTGTGTKTVTFTEGAVLELGANDLTGGTTPSVTVTEK